MNDGDTLTKTSGTILLEADQFVPIKVRYYDVIGDAFVSLLWSSASQSMEVIPESAFHTLLDPVTI